MMILRRGLLFLLPLSCVVPTTSFQPTHAHFPTPSTIHRQFERKHASTCPCTSTSLRASTILPPPPLLSSDRHAGPVSYHRPLTTKQSPQQGLFRPKKQELWLDESAYQRRKEEWARKYTSVDALRQTFGANRSALGDLDPQTARRLYKTLLPKALLELYKMGVHPEDLAPLAYRARVAAKLYARERCSLPFRVAANLYDGFRQWRRYGSFDTHGMSFQQVWEKYSNVILEQSSAEDLTSDDVTAQICLKILERSCSTNEIIDNLFLRDEEGKQDLEHFTQTLEQDVRRLLQPVKEVIKPSEQEINRFRTLRRVARIKRRLNKSLHRNSIKTNSHEDTRERDQDHSRSLFPWQNHHRSQRQGKERH